jgi:hypothetical protein
MKNRGAWLAAAASLAAVIACGSGNNGSNNSGNGTGSGSGGFPYTGPSCSSTIINQGCWGCLQNTCNGGCLTSACSDFFNCFCNCAQGSNSCYQGCASSISQSCQQCVLSVSSCEMSSCSSSCGNFGNGSGGVTPPGPGPGGSGSSGGSSSGGGMFQTCGGSEQPCASGASLEFCQAGFNNMCTSAFYQVGNQTFPCASCSDTASCLNEAEAACTPIMDAGPPPEDAGPVPDAPPPFDAGSVTCTPHPCGTMGQSMTFCESIESNNVCTAAWFEVAGQTFYCNSCTDCTTAAQEASKSCP